MAYLLYNISLVFCSFWPLCFLSLFDIRILIITLVYSNPSESTRQIKVPFLIPNDQTKS